jgi:hypothetical protein
MNERISHSQMNALLNARTDRNVEHALDNALRGINYTDASIRQRIGSIRSLLDDIERKLDASYQLNDLGEMQSRGLELDVAIVKNHLHWETAAALLTEDELASIRPSAK